MAVGVERKAVRRIVVDDSSYDGTAKAARGEDILVISCEKNPWQRDSHENRC